VLETVRLRHLDSPKFKDVVSVCSILIGDRPVGTAEPDQVVVRPGDTVELLPPFAGG
jgi:molybdopterin converting factor small subunit